MDFTAYIETISSSKRTLLYQSPWTSLAVFRNLPPLARAYVLRLLFVDTAFPEEYVDNWAKSEARTLHREAIAKLCRLELLQAMPVGRLPASTPNGTLLAHAPKAGPKERQQGWALHPDFKAQLQVIVCQGGQLMSGMVPRDVRAACPSPEQLDVWAVRQWEALQLYLLGASARMPSLPGLLAGRCQPLDMKGMLQQAGLMAGGPDGMGRPAAGGAFAGVAAGGGGRSAVTAKGFQFLLQPPDRQLWAVLREYIRRAEGSDVLLSSTLSFLLQLGFRRVGQPCIWDALSKQEQVMAGHMVQLGLLAAFEVAGCLYYTPTRLASSLCGGGAGAVAAVAAAGADAAAAAAHQADGRGGPSAAAGSGEGYIIVETNYRVYAYTRSPVSIAVLELFCKREALLPNLFVGSITRDSVLAALAKGISADELVAYLQQRPHPSILARTQVVPEVVTDQIRQWEKSTKRIKADAAVLYENIETRGLYEGTMQYARAQGYLLWADDAGMRFAALDSGHNDIKAKFGQLKRELSIA